MASRRVRVPGSETSKTALSSASLPGREGDLSARPGRGTRVSGEAQARNAAEKPFTILVVDDSPHILQAIRDFLPDYNVITAGSGEEALRTLLRNHVHLVLLDVRMDGMDGIETATRIRERKQSENIPIIFMSGIDQSDYQVFEGYQAGGVDYIFKPFTPEILRAKIFVFSQLFRTTEELKASEAQLVRKNRELRERSADLERQAELLDLARNAIIVMDLEGRISFWNAGAETMYGWAKASAKGKATHDLLHTSFPEPLEGIMARLMAEGAWTGELVHTAKDGRQVTVESHWTLRRGENEERPEIMEISIDITERKRLEEHARQAQKMEAIGTMAGGIAHDFNNILAAVIGFTEMSLDDAPKGSPLEKNLRWILQSGMRGKDLVKQIVAFSRKNEAARGPLRLSPVIDETVNLLRAAIPSSIRVEVHNRAGTDTVFASSGEIQQVILNLCTNAVHAMREDVGTLTIELSDAEPGCAELPINPRAASRELPAVVGDGHRHGHGRSGEGKNLRTLLYHERKGQRHRHGPCRCLRDRERAERRSDRRECPRKRRHVPGIPSADRCRGSIGGNIHRADSGRHGADPPYR